MNDESKTDESKEKYEFLLIAVFTSLLDEMKKRIILISQTNKHGLWNKKTDQRCTIKFNISIKNNFKLNRTFLLDFAN